MWKTTLKSIHSPKIVTATTVAAYVVLLILGVDVLTALPSHPFIYWIPALMMVGGALVGAPCAWFGGTKNARKELIFMPISIAGLLGGIIIEVGSIWTTSFSSRLLIYLAMIVLLIVILRWVYLRRSYNI